ncbi:MAG: PspC domain-containing protein [Nocardioides sp.]
MTSTPSPAGPVADNGTPGPTWPTEQPAPMGTGPRVTAEQVRDLSRLRRVRVDRKIGGVAGGVARHLDIDPLVVRVAFVVLSLFGGAGLVMYAAGWILLPEDGEQRQPLGLDDRSRSVALILAGVLGVALLVGQWDWFWVPGPLILVALVVWLFVSRRQENAGTPPPGPSPAPSSVPPGAGPNAVTPEQRWGATPPAYAQATAPVSAPAPAYEQPTATYAQARPHATRYVSPAPRNPRKRGPKLFWFTMALAALAVGVVGIIDVSGAPVTGSLYPAVVTAVIGVMLVVGSFFGRAGGLILVGLIAAVVTAGGLASEKVDGDTIEVLPRTSSQVESDYSFDVGKHVLDLTQLADPEALDGTTINVTGHVGELDVVVPEGMDVTVDAVIGGPGGISLFGVDSGGIDTTKSATYDGGSGPDVPHVTFDLTLDVGHIDVRTR